MDPALIEEYYRPKCNKTRVVNRTSCHLLSRRALSPYFDLQYNVGDSFDLEARKTVLALLRRDGADLRRGDLILLGPDLGYKNSGVYIYDGRDIVDLSDNYDQYGEIPDSFQAIVEFPPKYWSQLIENNTLVPFNFNEYFPDIDQMSLRLYPYNNLTIFGFTFDNNGTEYTILDDNAYDLSKANLAEVYNYGAEFVARLKKNTYFSYYRNGYPIGKDLDPEHVLTVTNL